MIHLDDDRGLFPAILAKVSPYNMGTHIIYTSSGMERIELLEFSSEDRPVLTVTMWKVGTSRVTPFSNST